MHHARTQIQKSGLMDEKWFVACFLMVFPMGITIGFSMTRKPQLSRKMSTLYFSTIELPRKTTINLSLPKLRMSSSLGNVRSLVTRLTATQRNRTSSMRIARSRATQMILVVVMRGSQRTHLLKKNLRITQQMQLHINASSLSIKFAWFGSGSVQLYRIRSSE